MPELQGLLKNNDRARSSVKVLSVLMHLFVVLKQANQRVAVKICPLVTVVIVFIP